MEYRDLGKMGFRVSEIGFGAYRVLIYQCLITCTGVASGIFFGESLGIEKMIGGVVILLGVYLARRSG